jgi:hypothetical protein
LEIVLNAAADATGKIEFVDHHLLGMPGGSYTITVDQAIEGPGIVQPPFSATQRFVVAGERFRLADDDVVAVFPPAGSLGDHADVLPHIILRRSTLPWERTAVRGAAAEPPIPWLAVLVFNEVEIKQSTTILLKDLRTAQPGWPDVLEEPGEHNQDPVTLIAVEQQLLAQLLPTSAELPYLAHVRRPTNTSGALAGEEWAVVIANRLPTPQATSVAHLVSLERRYVRDSQGDGYHFATDGATGSELVRLVSLKSWRFACLDEQQSLQRLLARLDHSPASLRLPPSGPAAEPFLARGYVPCPHQLRRGATSVSWYHGPFVPPGAAEPASQDLFPLRAADALIRYDQGYGMFDLGYAAAWELGRLLMLNSDRVASSLYQWRRHYARYVHAEGHLAEPHLPVISSVVEAPPLPAIVSEWMERASLLHGVPFNYLVPDEKLLPVESLRLFMLDPQWLTCLLDGAFSVGRTSSADHNNDATHQPAIAAFGQHPVYGFLLRSAVVAGWPSLLVNGYRYALPSGAKSDPIPPEAERPILRMERLSTNVLLCLFDGEPNVIDFHQQPEALHFGVRRSFTEHKQLLSKALRDADGAQLDVKVEQISLRPGSSSVIDIADLAGQIEAQHKHTRLDVPLNAAQFALQMIEGAVRVRFIFDRGAPGSRIDE